MLNSKLLEILSHEVDGAVTIVTQGTEESHLVNTWNSYIKVVEGNKLLIPAYGFMKTQKNLLQNPKVKLSICNRHVEGYRGEGTGLIVEGVGEILTSGPNFDVIKAEFDWARASLLVTVVSSKQTL